MAADDRTPTAPEKGKGRAEDTRSKDLPHKTDESKKDRDGKAKANGKVIDEPQEGEYICHELRLQHNSWLSKPSTSD